MLISIIAAAGNGTRLGKNLPKALVPIGGYPMLTYSLSTFAMHSAINSIIIPIPPQLTEAFHAATEPIAHKFPHINIMTISGGKERGDSISAALAHIPNIESHQIIVHDAARPFTPKSIIDETTAALSHNIPAIIPVLPVIDTIKLCQSDGTIRQTLPREHLVRAQTPQGFQGKILRDAYYRHNPALFTDDASMVEAMGITVKTIRGSELSRKITTPEDLNWAENYVRENHIQL